MLYVDIHTYIHQAGGFAAGKGGEFESDAGVHERTCGKRRSRSRSRSRRRRRRYQEVVER